MPTHLDSYSAVPLPGEPTALVLIVYPLPDTALLVAVKGITVNRPCTKKRSKRGETSVSNPFEHPYIAPHWTPNHILV